MEQYIKERERERTLLLRIVLFCFFFVFFTNVHRIGIFDADDWTYIGFARDALPDANAWNPTRVFPEIFMPTVGTIAAFVITPIVGDYLNAVTFTTAAAVSICVSCYIVFFALSIRRSFQLKWGQTLVISLLFLVAHFWVFRTKLEGNSYLFLARNLTCYFYYTVPTLLCSILVLFFEMEPYAWRKFAPAKKGLLYLTIYFALYSNLFSSIVLVAYSGVVLLQNAIRSVFRRERIFNAINKTSVHLVIIVVWLFSLVFELQGGRASSVGTDGQMPDFVSSAKNLINVFKNVNWYFVLFAVLTCCTAFFIVFLDIKHDKTKQVVDFINKEFRFLMSAVITATYQILLCGVTSLSGYLNCADVQVSIFFFIFAFIFHAAGYVVKRFPAMETILPIVLCIAVFNCNTMGQTYLDGNLSMTSQESAIAITRYAYDSIIEADKEHIQELNLHMPMYPSSQDNWPLSNYYGERMSRTLYEHGQISQNIKVNIIIDETLNHLYGLN